MQGSTAKPTFRELDGNVEFNTPVWPLEIWYEEVRDTPLSEMDIEDLVRACRQHLYPEEIVPLCLEKLEKNPLVGDLYDGEMVVALKEVDKKYWLNHSEDKKRLLRLSALAYQESLAQGLPGSEDLMVSEEHLMQEGT